LAAVGIHGIGALVFSPAIELVQSRSSSAIHHVLADLADNAMRIYEGSDEEVLPELLAGGGSPGGARPKVLAGVRITTKDQAEIYAGELASLGAPLLPDGYEPWIIKFPARSDGPDAGAIEMAYSIMARQAGIEMPSTRLFMAGDRRFFGIARFDRHGIQFTERSHMHTLGGLLEADYRQPSLDYDAYLKVAYQLLGGSIPAASDAFRRMVFNVLSNNRDDHVRNFAFLMSPEGDWRLSPAYDLTFSDGPNGEHTTSINGEGKKPSLRDMLKVAEQADLQETNAMEVFEEVSEAVSDWRHYAKDTDVSPATVKRVATRLAAIRKNL
jgi:serine/threonine-protein kinase HipA